MTFASPLGNRAISHLLKYLGLIMPVPGGEEGATREKAGSRLRGLGWARYLSP
jgi:hypothetical protein